MQSVPTITLVCEEKKNALCCATIVHNCGLLLPRKRFCIFACVKTGLHNFAYIKRIYYSSFYAGNLNGSSNKNRLESNLNWKMFTSIVQNFQEPCLFKLINVYQVKVKPLSKFETTINLLWSTVTRIKIPLQANVVILESKWTTSTHSMNENNYSSKTDRLYLAFHIDRPSKYLVKHDKITFEKRK